MNPTLTQAQLDTLITAAIIGRGVLRREVRRMDGVVSPLADSQREFLTTLNDVLHVINNPEDQ